MRIVFTGGGTGGHVFPIIVVARELGRRVSDVDMRFVGPLPFGAELLVREGMVVRGIRAGKLPRYFTPKIFLEIVKIPVGFLQALWEVYWFMPDVVFGKGGYGMVPVVFAAWLFRIPVVLHESDAYAGLATRISARFARTVLTAFPETDGLRHRDMRVVGNPVRAALKEGIATRAQERFHLGLKPTLLVLGGSQGSEEVNDFMVDMASELAGEVEIIHQVGQRSIESITREVALALEHHEDVARFYHIVSFFDEPALADAYAVATLAISRAGAGAIFELALNGVPTILLPLKNAAGNHQYLNGQIVSNSGAAIVLAGPNLSSHFLLKEVQNLLANEEARKLMSERFRAFAKPDAGKAVAEILAVYDKGER